MSTAQLKSDLHHFIDTIHDNAVLKAIHILLDKQVNDTIAGYSPNGKAISRKALAKRIEKSEAEVGKGHYFTLEELEKEAESW